MKEQLAIDTIRMLGIEMVANAASGHPGIVLGAAPAAFALFARHLNADPDDPGYFNRDRFVLSAGHGSALLYATMYAARYAGLSLSDLKAFRQAGSKTSGHPEPRLLPGVDLGTGPLGQGAAASVGFAIAEAYLNARYAGAVDHFTYCLLGDGCLQEGVCNEAIAIAGRHNLRKLVWLYDSNGIQLDGKVSDSTATDCKKLFEANGWDYLSVKDGNDFLAVSDAIARAKGNGKPTLVEIKTTLGYASESAGTHKAHGTPLTWPQVEAVRERLNRPYREPFSPDPKASEPFAEMRKRAAAHRAAYLARLDRLRATDPKAHAELVECATRGFDFSKIRMPKIEPKATAATRALFGEIFAAVAKTAPNVMVLNNDLSSSTKVKDPHSGWFGPGAYDQKNVNVGVREFASGAIALGINAHGGVRAVTSTFLSFADYAKPAIRLAAINGIGSVYVFSHDSITVGEDGPTHQPVEQLAMLRSTPNVLTFRPANARELFEGLIRALQSKDAPVCIVTSRAEFAQTEMGGEDAFANGYYFAAKTARPHVNLVATGSEVGLCARLAGELKKDKINANVVAVTSMELLRNNAKRFEKAIAATKAPAIAIEYGSPHMWHEFADFAFGIDGYGSSAPAGAVAQRLGVDAAALKKRIKKAIGR